jgi:transcription elongation factor Elf1
MPPVGSGAIMTSIPASAMDRIEQPVKRRRHCPVCGSEELTRPISTWLERMVEKLVSAHKFRCFICGHVFTGQVRVSEDKDA